MKPPPTSRRSGLTVGGLLEVGAALAYFATITGFLGRAWWIFDLTSHFRLHLAVALGLMAVVWTVRRRRRIATLCAVAAAVNVVLVLLLFWPEGKQAAVAGPRLRLVALNVQTENERSDLVLEFLRHADADVILLLEVNRRWLSALESLRTTYPQVIADPREDNFGIALFSRLPLTNGEVIELGNAGVPTIAATITVAGQNVFLLGTHPLPPGSSENARLRNEQFQEITARVRREVTPAIVLGDLNSTPWSPYFADLLGSSGLKNSSQGRGLFESWPSWMPIGRIALDHCLVAPSLHVLNKQLGPRVGSDHFPVVIEVQIPSS